MTKAEFKTKIPTLNKQQLYDLGFREWSDPIKGYTTMLIPGSLYNSIPNGFEVVDISNEKEKFRNGVSDNDTRFGVLPYGVRVKDMKIKAKKTK